MFSRHNLKKKKTHTQEKAGGVIEVVEYLPSKDEALSSSTSTAKKNKISCSLHLTYLILLPIGILKTQALFFKGQKVLSYLFL
jgi:hypothetical protein